MEEVRDAIAQLNDLYGLAMNPTLGAGPPSWAASVRAGRAFWASGSQAAAGAVLGFSQLTAIVPTTVYLVVLQTTVATSVAFTINGAPTAAGTPGVRLKGPGSPGAVDTNGQNTVRGGTSGAVAGSRIRRLTTPAAVTVEVFQPGVVVDLGIGDTLEVWDNTLNDTMQADFFYTELPL
jgi:hypothetical protein